MDSSGNLINTTTFSNEFAKILLLSAAEFEVITKLICKESEKEIPDNANIVRISTTILTSYPHIIDTEIRTPYKINYPYIKMESYFLPFLFMALKHKI